MQSNSPQDQLMAMRAALLAIAVDQSDVLKEILVKLGLILDDFYSKHKSFSEQYKEKQKSTEKALGDSKQRQKNAERLAVGNAAVSSKPIKVPSEKSILALDKIHGDVVQQNENIVKVREALKFLHGDKPSMETYNILNDNLASLTEQNQTLDKTKEELIDLSMTIGKVANSIDFETLSRRLKAITKNLQTLNQQNAQLKQDVVKVVSHKPSTPSP